MLIFIFIYLAVPDLTCGTPGLQLWHVGSSSLIRDRTCAPCNGSMGSLPVDHLEVPLLLSFEATVGLLLGCRS